MAIRPPVRTPGQKRAPVKGLQQRPLLSSQLLASMGPKRPPQAGPAPGIKQLVQALGAPPQHPVDIPGGGPAGTAPQHPTAVPNPPAPTAGGMNPYTGKPLGPNEYVGVAGSEAEHPGMTRIPPPGWWDPSNPNYERRRYYRDAQGNAVAIEPGYHGDAEHPYDTGRAGERNTEYGRSGEGIVDLGEPGVPNWSAGQERPKAPTYQRSQTPAAQSAPSARTSPVLDALSSGAEATPQHPSEQLMALLRALLGQVPGGGRGPSIPA